MGIFDGISNLFDTAVSDVTGIFSGQPDMGGSYLNSPSFDPLTYQYQPQVYQIAQNQAPPNPGGMIPNLPAAVGGVISSIPKWASAFPNLWGYVSRFKRPARVVAQLLNFLGRFGPVALTALVGAQIVSELFAYKVTHKKRRMNPANSRALRRSLRRLKSFDRLCHRVNGQLHRGGRRAPARRCVRCRKSPCAC
jgi:hypothetical protein